MYICIYICVCIYIYIYIYIHIHTAIGIQPSNIGKLKIELRAKDEIAEKKLNTGKMNSEELRKMLY